MANTKVHLRLRSDKGNGKVTDRVFYNRAGLLIHYEDGNGKKHHHRLLKFKREWNKDLKKWILKIFYYHNKDNCEVIRKIIL